MHTRIGQHVLHGSLAAMCLAVGAMSTVSARPAFAATLVQEVTTVVSGTVLDARSNQPVVGASVSIVGTRLGAITGNNGKYRIALVPTGAQVIFVRQLGYTPQRRAADLTNTPVTIDFTMELSATSLDHVIVTATAGGELRRSLGNAVATINADDAIAKSSAQSVSSLIGARAPGVIIGATTGRLGAGPSIQIRGRSSIGLDNSPLIFIDGIRVNNATGTGPVGVAGRLGGQASSVAGRLNDVSPEDIESIEIIKGPAAATIYGTEAANGVIQITTKRGIASARPQFSVSVEQGTIAFRDPAGRVPTNYAKDSSGTVVAWNGIRSESDRGTPVYTTGHTRKYIGSLSGGREGLSYYVSTNYQNDLGVEPNNSLRQAGFRVNLNAQPGSSVDVATSLSYQAVAAHLGADVGLSPLLGAVLGHSLLFPKARGFFPNFSPDIPQTLIDNAQNVFRFLGSTSITHRPTTWFTHRLTVGVDETGDDSRAIEHFTSKPEFVALMGAVGAAGSIGQTLRHNRVISSDYSATVRKGWTSSLTTATSVGGQYYRTEDKSNFLGGTGFPGVGVETVNSAANPASSSQAEILNTTLGVYAQEVVSWKDRLYVTGAVRVDNNSAFGDQLKWVTYPKVSLSWVTSQESFWHTNDVVNSLRLRSAYGQSGRQPVAFSALRTFSPTQGPGGTSAVTPASIGNSGLKPERGSELELGFESRLFDRLDLNFTYFNKRTTDLIINQPTAPSTGFYVATPANLGRVDNHGVELLASLQVAARRNFAWDVVGNIATNKDVIKDLGGIGGIVLNSGQSNVVGGPIGGLYSRRVVSADRNTATGGAMNLLCDGGNGKPAVDCATAPFVFIGTPTPALTGSVANTFTMFNKLRLYMLVDFKRGYRVFNADDFNRCQGAAGANLCRTGFYPLDYDPVYLAEHTPGAAGRKTLDQLYEDGSFAKLREVSLNYLLPAKLLGGYQSASITVAGRDLLTWTKYSGIDPEVNAFNVASSSGTLSQAVTPPLTRFIVTFNLKF